MNFQPHLAQLVITGSKTVTRRIASSNPRSPWSAAGCKLRIGSDYAVCPGRGKHAIGRTRVVSVDLMPLGHLTDEEAQREGFASPAAFEEAFARINGAYDVDVLVWRVALELSTGVGGPVRPGFRANGIGLKPPSHEPEGSHTPITL